MPTFWQQPLTWLFLIATACLDAVALKRFWMSDFFELLLMGQAIVAGAWLAMGTSHRLARAGVALGLILALSAHDYAREGKFGALNEWQYVLGIHICFVVATAVAAWLLARTVCRPCCDERASRWRISIAEILGWMVITAVGAATLPHARFAFADDLGSSFVQILALPVTAAALIVAYRPAMPAPPSRAKWLAAALLTALTVVAALAEFTELIACGITLAYVSGWIIVQRLDARPRPKLVHLRVVAP